MPVHNEENRRSVTLSSSLAIKAKAMPVHYDKSTLVSALSYRRDLYQLIVLLLADEKVADHEQFKELSKVHHETEVNRLLILIATATRQFLDLKSSSVSKERCGQYWPAYPGQAKDLLFRQACNSIIHAVEIIPHDLNTGFHEGTILIRGRPRKPLANSQPTRAELDFDGFAKCCYRLSNEFE